MPIRASIPISLSVLLTCCSLGVAAAGSDSQGISFEKPVQIPEAVLQPGNYTIRVEDSMADRAIVRISEAGGTDHYLLGVPAAKLKAPMKGLIFFPARADTDVLHGWQCQGCARPLEFVYPKDEAVKLTAKTGEPVLAYDPSYDKLPALLSPADRKIVTLWLLRPKAVAASGRGEGLTAAKYSAAGLDQAKMSASHVSLPKKMPKTASVAFLEIMLGCLSFAIGMTTFLRRKPSAVAAVPA